MQFQALENRTHRLSSSLGVGKIKDSSLANGVLGFIREGIRFAFSRSEIGSDEPLFLGARLPFLRLLSKYVIHKYPAVHVFKFWIAVSYTFRSIP